MGEDTPDLRPKTAANNVKKATVTATGDGTNTATQNITVTVTASGDAVVTLVVTPDEIAEGGSSTVSATLKSAASSAFSVMVDVDEDDNARGYTISTNRALFFAEGATRSSGAPVKITSTNDNAYTGDQELTVTGRLSPPDDDMTVKSATLTVTDNDVPFGKVTLVLSETSIGETVAGATATDARSRGTTTLSATLVGGETFEEAVTVTLDDVATDIVEGLQSATLTIPADARTSVTRDNDGNIIGGTITITAVDDTDDDTEVVVISGTASDGGVTTFPKASQPADVNLIITDDDVAPGAPTALDGQRRCNAQRLHADVDGSVEQGHGGRGYASRQTTSLTSTA